MDSSAYISVRLSLFDNHYLGIVQLCHSEPQIDL